MKLIKDCVCDILIYIEEKSVYEEIGMGKSDYILFPLMNYVNLIL